MKGATCKELYFLNETRQRDKIKQIYLLNNNAVVAVCKSRLKKFEDKPYYLKFGYNPHIGMGIGVGVGPITRFESTRTARAYLEDQFEACDPKLVIDNELLEKMEVVYNNFIHQDIHYVLGDFGYMRRADGQYTAPLFPTMHSPYMWEWCKGIMEASDLSKCSEGEEYPTAQQALVDYEQKIRQFLSTAEDAYRKMVNWHIYKTKTTRKAESLVNDYTDFWTANSTAELLLPSIFGDDPADVDDHELHLVRENILLHRDYVPQRQNDL